MANRQHLSILKQGTASWNEWREQNPDIKPDLREAALEGINLSRADLTSANLREANLASADLREANLFGATLWEAALNEANLSRANLGFADLTFADLTKANLMAAKLWKADLTAAKLVGADLTVTNLSTAILRETDLSSANLNGAELNYAILVETNLKKANLTGCSVYGISTWDIQLGGAIQADLIITPPNDPTITVDNLEVAQFIYVLLNNKKIHDIIDRISSKLVLILARFTPERKQALDAIKSELRKQNYSPVSLDFEKPLSRDFTETVSTLAQIARFIIADLTAHKSIAQELQVIIPRIAVPVQPLLSGSKKIHSMFPDFKKYPWVLPEYRYKDQADLLASLSEKVIRPAVEKSKELERQST